MKIYSISKRPLWYHGSNKLFNKFNDYSWFTESKTMASNYISWATEGKKANILYNVILNTNNTLDLTQYDVDDKMAIDSDEIELFLLEMNISIDNSEIEKEIISNPHIEEVHTSWVLNKALKAIRNFDSLKILESGVLTCCVFDGNNVSIVKTENVSGGN